MGYLNSVLSDKVLEEKLKNIIFLIGEKKVSLVAFGPLVFSRVILEKAEVSGVEAGEEKTFQIKASGLNNMLSSFSNLYKTHVDEIEFSEEGIKIKAIVHEEANEGESKDFSNDIKYLFDSAKIGKHIMAEIHEEFPSEDVVSTECGEVLLYLDSLMPLLSSGTSGTLSNKIHFADDYVFVLGASLVSFYKNRLPKESFSNITLGSSSLVFLKKLCDTSDYICSIKTDKYLCVESGNIQAFIKYKPVNIKYNLYLDKFSKDIGVSVNRLYLKDILRRMGYSHNDCVMSIDDRGGMTMKNESIHQIIPLESVKEETKGLTFKTSIPVLEKAILGSDNMFTDSVFIYMVKMAGGSYSIYLKDKTGSWLSSFQARKV